MSAPIERRSEWLYGEELHARMDEKPLAWLPFGILEHHGEHLPWGLDGLKAYAVCLRLAEKLEGVVLPASHLAGVHGDRLVSRRNDFAFNGPMRAYGPEARAKG